MIRLRVKLTTRNVELMLPLMSRVSNAFLASDLHYKLARQQKHTKIFS
jgi:hypothetical protein